MDPLLNLRGGIYKKNFWEKWGIYSKQIYYGKDSKIN